MGEQSAEAQFPGIQNGPGRGEDAAKIVPGDAGPVIPHVNVDPSVDFFLYNGVQPYGKLNGIDQEVQPDLWGERIDGRRFPYVGRKSNINIFPAAAGKILGHIQRGDGDRINSLAPEPGSDLRGLVGFEMRPEAHPGEVRFLLHLPDILHGAPFIQKQGWPGYMEGLQAFLKSEHSLSSGLCFQVIRPDSKIPPPAGHRISTASAGSTKKCRHWRTLSVPVQACLGPAPQVFFGGDGRDRPFGGGDDRLLDMAAEHVTHGEHAGNVRPHLPVHFNTPVLQNLYLPQEVFGFRLVSLQVDKDSLHRRGFLPRRRGGGPRLP